MTKISNKLSLQIIGATNTPEVDRWIGEVEKEIGGISLQYVGGVANNRGSAEVATTTHGPVLEKVTNCMDAILEWQKCLHANDRPQSPREAARRWLGATPSDLVSKLFRVGMLEGDSDKRPTISLRDFGIGQNPDRFLQTFLSIHASNKQNKPWLHGRYNMGGMAAYKFAMRTIFISKRHKDAGDSKNEVGATVVLRDTSNSMWPFVYLADRNGDVITLDLPEWDAGTEVRLVSYELPDYCGRVNQQTHSLRHLFMSAFPNPTIPFSVEELRPRILATDAGNKNRGLKTIGGLLQQLEGSIPGPKMGGKRGASKPVCIYNHPSTLNVPNPEGAPELENEIVLHIRVLDEDAGKNKDYYTQSENQIIFSLNGQRQMSLTREWVRTATQYHQIAHRIICVADCSSLSEHARTALFSSTRESGARGEYHDLVVNKVREDLKNDVFLQQIESDTLEKNKSDAVHTASDRIKKQLLQEISGQLGGKGNVRLGSGGRERRKRRSTDDSHLNHTPTRIRIENNPVKAKAGRTVHITLDVDAKNGYFPGHGKAIEVISQSLGTVAGVQHGTLLGGVLRVSFDLPDTTPIGEHDILVSLRDTPANQIFSDRGKLVVSADDQNPDKKKRGGRNARNESGGGKGGAEIDWIFHGKEKWAQYGWDAGSVGTCSIDKDEDGRVTRILFDLNRDYKELVALVDNKSRSKKGAQQILNRYGLAICPQMFGIQEFKEGRSEAVTEEEKKWVARAAIKAIEPEVQMLACGTATEEEPTGAEDWAEVACVEPLREQSGPARAKRHIAGEAAAAENFRATGGVIDTH